MSMESDSDDNENVPGRAQGLSDDNDWFSVTGDDSLWGCGWDDEELWVHEAKDKMSSGCTGPSPTAEKDLEDALMEVSNRQEDMCHVKLYDLGTTRHITPDHDHMLNVWSIPPKSFTAANQQKFSTMGVGNLIIKIPNGAEILKLYVTEVLYSPEVGYMLMSIGRLYELGLSMTFADGYCTIHNADGETIGHILQSSKGLYCGIHEGEHAAATMERLTIMEFHHQMGYIALSVAWRLAEQELVSGLEIDMSKDKPTFCESCIYGKATYKPIVKEHEGPHAESISNVVFSNVWGPVPVTMLGGKHYYVMFTDDSTQLTHFWPLWQKSETFEAYWGFEAWLDRQLVAKIKLLHLDWGGEYQGKEFILYLERQGTVQHLTVHDTPQHNSIAKWLNQTILEKVHAMLHASGLPKFLWGEAAHHAVWLKNRTPTKVLAGGSPYEVVLGKTPDLSWLREWGLPVFVKTGTGTQLGGHVEHGKWMGIDERTKNACHMYWPLKRTVTVECNMYILWHCAVCCSGGKNLLFWAPAPQHTYSFLSPQLTNCLPCQSSCHPSILPHSHWQIPPLLTLHYCH